MGDICPTGPVPCVSERWAKKQLLEAMWAKRKGLHWVSAHWKSLAKRSWVIFTESLPWLNHSFSLNVCWQTTEAPNTRAARSGGRSYDPCALPDRGIWLCSCLPLPLTNAGWQIAIWCPAWNESLVLSQFPAASKKPSPQLAVGTETSCSGVLKAGQPKAQGCGESLPCHQPCCTGTGKDWVQESLKTGAAYFFQWDFGGSPARDVILLPSPTPIFSFSIRCLAIALALLFWSADKKKPSVPHHVPPSRTGHGTASRDESPFTGQHWQAASAAGFRFCRWWQSPGRYGILRALHKHELMLLLAAASWETEAQSERFD